MSSRSLRRNRRAAAAGALAATLGFAGLGLASAPAGATADFDLERLAGADRIETAVEISQDTFTSATTALIARADLYPDALAGNYLAGAEQAPILLSHTGDVPAETLAELDRLGVTDVTLLGGTSALSQDVQDELEAAGLTVNREAGTDRYKTAAEIATSQDAAGIGEVDGARTAILATGERFPDALTGGPLAYAGSHPILLTPTASLGADAAGALEALEIEHVIILGGTAAVSQAAEDAVEAAGMTTERLAGATRYSTATEIAEWAIANAGFSNTHVDVATGQNFPDALTGGPHAGENMAPILLANDGNTAEAEAFLESIANTVAEGHIFGGTAAVSAAVEAALEAAGQSVTGDTGTVTSSAADPVFFDTADGRSLSADLTDGDTDNQFFIDGTAATQAVFQAATSPGDTILVTKTDGDADYDIFRLTNNPTPASGLVGEVGADTNDFSIITAAGNALNTLTYGDANETYSVDGGSVSLAAFEAALSLGDTVTTTDTSTPADGNPDTFALTNGSWDGAVGNITETAGVEVTFDADGTGDDPDLGADDTLFSVTADEVTAGTQVLTIGGAAATYQQFEDAITAGDSVVYSRAAGVERFALTNVVVNTSFSGTTDDNTNSGADTIGYVSGTTQNTFVYTGVDVFRVNGVVSTQGEFETALDGGSTLPWGEAISYDMASDTLSLTTATSFGPNPIDDIIFTDDGSLANETFDVVTTGGLIYVDDLAANGVLGTTATARWFVNGVEVAEGVYENYLVDIAGDPNTNGDSFQVVLTALATEHRLTTDNTL